MIIRYSVEPFNHYWSEMELLYNTQHKLETAEFQDKVRIELNSELFSLFEQNGKLHSVIARDSNKLIAYYISLLHNHLYFKFIDKSSYITASQVLLYFVDKAYRGQGIGSALRDYSKDDLKTRKVQLLLSETKVKLPYAKLYKTWTNETLGYSKWIGE